MFRYQLMALLPGSAMSQSCHKYNVAARALATYVIPGCVGRGVKLGSEGSSGGGGGGGVWKSGDLEIQMFSPKQKLSFSDT